MQIIFAMTEEQKTANVTLLIDGEYVPIDKIEFTDETHVLDKGHPYLMPKE